MHRAQVSVAFVFSVLLVFGLCVHLLIGVIHISKFCSENCCISFSSETYLHTYIGSIVYVPMCVVCESSLYDYFCANIMCYLSMLFMESAPIRSYRYVFCCTLLMHKNAILLFYFVTLLNIVELYEYLGMSYTSITLALLTKQPPCRYT